MSVLDLLLGKPLASDEARAECIGTAAGIPIFGLDALSSAAYCSLSFIFPIGKPFRRIPAAGGRTRSHARTWASRQAFWPLRLL